MRRLSIIVISRTISNLEALFEGITNAYSGPLEDLEIIVSWNGDPHEANSIEHLSQFDVKVLDIRPYNFASNNNKAFQSSSAIFVLFINDDIVLDEGALDLALSEISHPAVGVVGANLRYQNGKIQHIGVEFREDGTPFHKNKGQNYRDVAAWLCPTFVPAVTGAFILMRAGEFAEILFDEAFEVAGEDIVLNLDYQEKFQRFVLLNPRISGVHTENATRKLTGAKETPASDLEIIRQRATGRSAVRKLRVRIVTEPEGWIMYRKAKEIEKNSTTLEVRINEDWEQADLHYYINYGKFNRRPSSGIVVANYTHFDADGLGDKYYTSADEVDFCTSVSQASADLLLARGVDPSKIEVIHVGAAREFKPKVLIGVMGRVYPGGRKGEDLVQRLARDLDVLEFADVVASSDGWGVPVVATETRQQFYSAIDYLLVPSRIEGGPVPFMEALACGTLSVAPSIGVVPEYPHIGYENGDYDSLKAAIMRVANDYRKHKEFVAAHMNGVDWQNWGHQHERLFHLLKLREQA